MVPRSRDGLLAPRLRDLFFAPGPDGRPRYVPSRYKVAHGGRGSGKSWGFARVALMLAAQRRVRVMCAREIQASIADSVHQLLADQIDALGLAPYFDVQQSSIVARHTGSAFLFAGLRTNVTKLKSTEGIDVLWVEEGEKVSDKSWQVVIPTVRKPGSEIWTTFNPDEETDPTYQRFVVEPPPEARVVQVGWQDNPWLSNELRAEKDYLYRVDPDAAAHVWGGECRRAGAAQILRGKVAVEAFDSEGKGWDGPYFGADWGFAQDPTALIRLWIDGTTLRIEHEAWGVGVDIDRTPALFDQVPGARQATVRADSARPETISYMVRHGYGGMVGVEKWSGSVEDGIAFLRSFERIVIHPRCRHTIDEARLWSYKVDRLTGDVKPEPEDRHNHCWDGVRYALAPVIKSSGRGILDFYRAQAEAAAAAKAQTPDRADAVATPLAHGPEALMAAMSGTH